MSSGHLGLMVSVVLGTVETVQIEDMSRSVTLVSEDGVVLAVVVHHDTLACLRLTQVSAVLRVGVEPQLRSNISIEEVVKPQSSSHSVVVNRL